MIQIYIYIYINVLKDLVENMNSSFNSGIVCILNDVNKNENKMNIEQITTQKMLDAVQENKNNILKVNANVRCVINKIMFDKGSEPKWSTKIHIIKEIKAHSVLLDGPRPRAERDNDKWYKYYQVMKVDVTEQKHVNALNELAGIKKNIKIQRTLKKEGLDLKNIIRKKRTGSARATLKR